MDSILIDVEDSIKLTDKEIFTKIWTSPRIVFKYINDKNYDKYVKVLLVLSGIARTFDRASMKNMGDQTSIWGVVGLSIVLGGLFGWISYYIYAALLSWTGKWLDGKGNTSSILRVLSYAMIPSIVALIFLIPQIAVYGNEIFKKNGDITSAGWILNTLVYSSFFIQLILAIYTIIFCVIGVSEVQKLSIGKSILNILLPLFVLLVPIFIIILIIKVI